MATSTEQFTIDPCALKGYVKRHWIGVWIGSCSRCGRGWCGPWSRVFASIDHHMRTESHTVCPKCRELRSGCVCR